MTSVSNASAALFRDRNLAANAQQAGDGSANAGSVAPSAALDGDARRRDANASGSSDAASQLDPSHIKNRIDGLVDGQVTAGKLTREQGDALKQVLSQAALRTDDPVPDGETVQNDSLAAPEAPVDDRPTTDTTIAPRSNSAPSPSETLATFIQNLQRAQTAPSAYASNGAAGSTPGPGSRLLDFNT